MLMEYDDFRTTEHLQEFISKEGFNRSIEAIKENAELDNKLNHLLANSISNEPQSSCINENADQSITYMGQTNEVRLENINNVLNFIFNVNKPTHIESYYSDIEEWHGIVESINNTTNKFKVRFLDKFGEPKYIVEFDKKHLHFSSDLKLLKVGANIVWILGYETEIQKVNDQFKPGTRTNVSQITIRRTKVLTKKQIKEAEENAEHWTEFFRKCKSED